MRVAEVKTTMMYIFFTSVLKLLTTVVLLINWVALIQSMKTGIFKLVTEVYVKTLNASQLDAK